MSFQQPQNDLNDMEDNCYSPNHHGGSELNVIVEIPGIPQQPNWTEQELINIGVKYRKMMINVDSNRFERNFKLAHDELMKAITLFPYQSGK